MIQTEYPIRDTLANRPQKTFHIYVDAYVKNIAGEFVNAGKAHQVEYIIQAESDVAAMIKFRQEHPDLEMASCEENVIGQPNVSQAVQQMMNHAADAIAYGMGGLQIGMLGLGSNK